MGSEGLFTAGSRGRATALFAVACASVVASGLAVASCITAPPPELPSAPTQRPTILHDAVHPPAALLYEWPSDETFLVPVQLGVPSAFYYNVFVDYSPPPAGDGLSYSGMGPGPANPPDGGISLVSFPLPEPSAPICPHRIDFLVASGFNANSPHTWNSAGGDIVTWWFYPDGGAGDCPPYDAGEGTFPDAPSDVLPVAPESGGDP